jgi:ABC-type uncharacterized transport system YnjBCD substrate-binding protein
MAKKPGRNRKARNRQARQKIQLPPSLASELQKFADATTKRFGRPSKYLFPSDDDPDKPWSIAEADAALHDLCKRAGVPPMTSADLAKFARENPHLAREMLLGE